MMILMSFFFYLCHCVIDTYKSMNSHVTVNWGFACEISRCREYHDEYLSIIVWCIVRPIVNDSNSIRNDTFKLSNGSMMFYKFHVYFKSGWVGSKKKCSFSQRVHAIWKHESDSDVKISMIENFVIRQ